VIIKEFLFVHLSIRVVFEYILRHFNFSEINSQQENDRKERKTDIFLFFAPKDEVLGIGFYYAKFFIVYLRSREFHESRNWNLFCCI